MICVFIVSSNVCIKSIQRPQNYFLPRSRSEFPISQAKGEVKEATRKVRLSHLPFYPSNCLHLAANSALGGGQRKTLHLNFMNNAPCSPSEPFLSSADFPGCQEVK